MNATGKNIEVREYEHIRERLVPRTALFGLLTWYEVQRIYSLGKNLVIHAQTLPDKIFINGDEYILGRKLGDVEPMQKETSIPQLQKEIEKEIEMLMKESPVSLCTLSKAYTDSIEGCLYTSFKKIVDLALGINIELVNSQAEQKGRDMAVNYILRYSSGALKENGDIRFDNITQKTLEGARKCRVYPI